MDRGKIKKKNLICKLHILLTAHVLSSIINTFKIEIQYLVAVSGVNVTTGPKSQQKKNSVHPFIVMFKPAIIFGIFLHSRLKLGLQITNTDN